MVIKGSEGLLFTSDNAYGLEVFLEFGVGWVMAVTAFAVFTPEEQHSHVTGLRNRVSINTYTSHIHICMCACMYVCMQSVSIWGYNGRGRGYTSHVNTGM